MDKDEINVLEQEANQIRLAERERLNALVNANMELANQLHADDFQLVTPSGRVFSKEGYLSAVASGDISYLVWEPDSTIEVRLYGQGAVIRYRSQLQIVFHGREAPLGHFWHIDSYEKRDGRWQVVWSQATYIE